MYVVLHYSVLQYFLFLALLTGETLKYLGSVRATVCTVQPWNDWIEIEIEMNWPEVANMMQKHNSIWVKVMELNINLMIIYFCVPVWWEKNTGSLWAL